MEPFLVQVQYMVHAFKKDPPEFTIVLPKNIANSL
jgi:hypothetical protein